MCLYIFLQNLAILFRAGLHISPFNTIWPTAIAAMRLPALDDITRIQLTVFIENHSQSPPGQTLRGSEGRNVTETVWFRFGN
jgi:hypothetical protein